MRRADMQRSGAALLLCSGLAACAVPGPVVGPPGNLTLDRQACNKAYPEHLGNYLAHAECVNQAVERDAIPFARYPDLVRLQEQLRVKYSALIDQRVLSAREGERKMVEADRLVEEATRDRELGRREAADHRVDRLRILLQ